MVLFFFLRLFFGCGPFLKSLLNVSRYGFCFFVLIFLARVMWDLSSPTRD